MRIFAVLFGFLVTFNVAYAAFPDVPEDHQNYDAVSYLQSKGIVGGYEDGTFLPDKEINRVEALKIILLSNGIKNEDELEGEIKDDFNLSDVPKDAWFYDYVGMALERGIVKGYDDGTFRPANQINLVETLKMAILAYELEFDESSGGQNWYMPYLNYALSKNIILLDENGQSHPETQMTRSMFAEILYRFAFMKEHKLDSFPISQDWDIYEKAVDNYRLKVPPGWEIREEVTRTVLWRRTPDQLDYQRLTPESATITIHKKDNLSGLLVREYFKKASDLYPDIKPVETVFNTLPALYFEMLNNRDYYVYLPNGKILILYVSVGNGLLSGQNMRSVEAAVKNLTYVESTGQDVAVEKAGLMENINSNLLIEGVGLRVIGQIGDASIFETDAIGVGTGAVDYYYSPKLDMTLKYERAGDIILNTRNGKTSKF